MFSWRSVENLIKLVIGNHLPAFNFPLRLFRFQKEENSLKMCFHIWKGHCTSSTTTTQSIHNGSTRVQKSAFWFEKKGKQIATRPMLYEPMLRFGVAKCKRVLKGVAYELIGSFSLWKKEKSISSSTVFFVLSVINLRSGVEKSESLLVIALALQINQTNEWKNVAQWD